MKLCNTFLSFSSKKILNSFFTHFTQSKRTKYETNFFCNWQKATKNVAKIMLKLFHFFEKINFFILRNFVEKAEIVN